MKRDTLYIVLPRGDKTYGLQYCGEKAIVLKEFMFVSPISRQLGSFLQSSDSDFTFIECWKGEGKQDLLWQYAEEAAKYLGLQSFEIL